jgi:hypothetical protein
VLRSSSLAIKNDYAREWWLRASDAWLRRL